MLIRIVKSVACQLHELLRSPDVEIKATGNRYNCPHAGAGINVSFRFPVDLLSKPCHTAEMSFAHPARLQDLEDQLPARLWGTGNLSDCILAFKLLALLPQLFGHLNDAGVLACIIFGDLSVGIGAMENFEWETSLCRRWADGLPRELQCTLCQVSPGVVGEEICAVIVLRDKLLIINNEIAVDIPEKAQNLRACKIQDQSSRHKKHHSG